MIVQKQVYKRFLTKKKLSSFAWTHWGFALITTIGIGFLFTVIEILKINDRKAVFYNIRTVNTENTKFVDLKNQATLTNNSPVFVFMQDNVLFGPLKSIVAPLPDHDVIILGKKWREDFSDKISYFKNNSTLFPARTYGVLFKYDLDYQKHVEHLKDTFELIDKQNKKINKNYNFSPATIILDFIKID